jgi:hypothetical protein
MECSTLVYVVQSNYLPGVEHVHDNCGLPAVKAKCSIIARGESG